MMERLAFYISILAGIIAIITFLRYLVSYLSLIAGWNFKIIHVELSSNSLYQGDKIAIRTIVKNTGRRPLGTYYGVIKIAYAYNHKNPIHDTHRDLSLKDKSKLRVVDVAKDSTKDFVYEWRVPKNLMIGVYDISVEIWNPPYLYGAKHKKCFDRTIWDHNFEVMAKDKKL